MTVYIIILIIIILAILFVKNFYRFPKKKLNYINGQNNKVYSPAYGKIMKITPEKEHIHIAIFLSPFDVHYQFSPVYGTIKEIQYDNTGKYKLAYKLDKSDENEKAIYIINTNRGDFIIYQIAGYLTRDIDIYVTKNKEIKVGDTLGLIHFGSRVDIVIPIKNNNFDLYVKVGDRVNGTNTILGKYI